MNITPFGYKIPATGDKGAAFFPALEFNFNRLSGHSHDGVNSPLLPAISLTKTKQTIAKENWTAHNNGLYRQLVTISASGAKYDDVSIEFRLSDGARIYPTVEKVGLNQYYVYVNDNTLDLTAIYT